MTTSILQALNASAGRGGLLSRFGEAFRMAKAARNPQAAMSSLIQNNPNMQRAAQLIQENGGDAQKAFFALASQMGVDPNEILSVLR